MNHLKESIICPHCGERLRVQIKENAAGDRVRRGVCPTIAAVNVTATLPWSTDWQMETRAAG